MLERVSATAESAATQFFLRNLERPCRSKRTLDPKFWRNGAQDSDTPAWWPLYLENVRRVSQLGTPLTDKKASHLSFKNNKRLYTQSTSKTQAQGAAVASSLENDHNDDEEISVPASTANGNTAENANDSRKSKIDSIDARAAIKTPSGYDLFPTFKPAAFSSYNVDLARYSAHPASDQDQNKAPNGQKEENHKLASHQDKIQVVSDQTRSTRSTTEKIEPIPDHGTVDTLPSPLSSSERKSISDHARFHDLTALDTSAGIDTGAVAGHYDEIWRLFLSFDNQADLAKKTFESLINSDQSRHKDRALVAYRLIPREQRTKNIYESALKLELHHREHMNAINLACQALENHVNIFPILTAHLVRGRLWNALGEMAHQYYKIQPNDQVSIISQRAGTPNTQADRNSALLSMCTDLEELPASVVSLTAQLEAGYTIDRENQHWLHRICESLRFQCVSSSNIMQKLTLEGFLSLVDPPHIRPASSISLHTTALYTLFKSPAHHSSADLALGIYRSLRYRQPSFKVSQATITKLVTFCGKAQYRPEVNRFLLDEFSTLHGIPNQIMYHCVLTSYARQGETDAMMDVWAEFCRHHGQPKELRHLSPLIYGYAMRGDANQAQHHFDTIASLYGLEPDTDCWNMLLLAQARSQDAVSTFAIYEKMKDKNVSLDSYTFGTLLSVCADRGDTDTALDLINEAKERKLPVTDVMIATLVETYLTANDVETASHLVQAASKSSNQGAKTRLWNSILRHHAFRGDLDNFERVYRQMQSLSVPTDEMTFATRLAILVSKGRTMEALQTTRSLRAQQNIKITPLHYSVILYGFMREGKRDMSMVLLHEMKDRFGAIGAHAQKAILRLQADRAGQRKQDEPPDYSSAIEFLQASLKSASPVHDQTVRGYMVSLITSMLHHKSYDQADIVLKHIKSESGDAKDKLDGTRVDYPTNLILQALQLTTEQQRWKETDQIWTVLFDRAIAENMPIERLRSIQTSPLQETSRKDQEDVSEPANGDISENTRGAVLQGRRFALDVALNYYMEALARQGQQSKLIDLLQGPFRDAGFALTGRNWNKYVQVLCRSDNPRHRIQAFRFTEEHLINRAQSWTHLLRGNFRRKRLLQSLEGQNIDRGDLQTKYSVVKRREAMSLNPAHRIPTYTTMVYLASVLDKAQRYAEKTGNSNEISKITDVAGKTKRFIQQMPFSNDKVQAKILRGKSLREESKPRPRSEKSHVQSINRAGILGSRSLLEQFPPEAFEEIQQLLKSRAPGLQPIDRKGRQIALSPADKITFAEKWTGTISRKPIMLSGQGRFESEDEKLSRIQAQEREKLAVFEAVQRDARSKHVSSGDYQGVGTTAGLPIDDSQALSSASKFKPFVKDLLDLAQKLRRTPVEDKDSTAAVLSASISRPSVQEQVLAFEAAKREGEQKLASKKSNTSTGLALPYAQRRRIRRNLAFQQRAAATGLPPSSMDEEKKWTRSNRTNVFYQAQQRRRRLLALYRLSRFHRTNAPVSPTIERALRRLQASRGTAQFRFVSPVRKTPRSAQLLSERERQILQMRRRERDGLDVSPTRLPVTRLQYEHGVKRSRLRRLLDAYSDQLRVTPAHKTRSVKLLKHNIMSTKSHLLRLGVMQADGSIDNSQWLQYLDDVMAKRRGSPRYWNAERLAQVLRRTRTDSTEREIESEQPVFTPFLEVQPEKKLHAGQSEFRREVLRKKKGREIFEKRTAAQEAKQKLSDETEGNGQADAEVVDDKLV